MSNAKILLAVTGGIAAYKAIDLASRLNKAGYQVRTVLTDSARKFVSPVNFSAITHNSVHTSLWDDADPIVHISLADWADLIVVAPASANTIAKAACGLANNLLSSILLAHTKPVLWVPAMNVHMYEHVATKQNMEILKSRGHHVLEPATGLLACAYTGKGKYPPNEEILYAIRTYLLYGRDLGGVTAIVSAGASVEAIDPMRMISNRSSGKMGIALARALSLRGAMVKLVYGSVNQEIPYYLHDAVQALSVEEMYDAIVPIAGNFRWIFKCAAVSDYKPASYSPQKIKKAEDLLLKLERTADILADLGRIKQDGQRLIGFAAETENLIENAKDKLLRKNLDLIVANHLENAGKDSNSISLIDKAGMPLAAQGDKFDLAHKIIDHVKTL
jgi:phosphopantothenoylcysteine decarboxylase/phosphopantothenate--cysteine ligase